MDLYLFAGIPVSDYQRAVGWYEQLLGRPPSMIPNDVEAVWDLAEFRSVYVVVDPAGAGHGRATAFVGPEDLVRLVAEISERGIEPESDETYGNGVRKVTYRDPDGNELGIGGGPTDG
ncbi:MAG: VOC family protein [Microbacterium sp.]|nr:MAG: VOC family protein [Microbacterium sp.]